MYKPLALLCNGRGCSCCDIGGGGGGCSGGSDCCDEHAPVDSGGGGGYIEPWDGPEGIPPPLQYLPGIELGPGCGTCWEDVVKLTGALTVPLSG